MSFIMPTIPWFLRSFGIPEGQVFSYMALTTVLNGAAFAAATPLMPRIVTDRKLPLLSMVFTSQSKKEFVSKADYSIK